MGLQKRKIEQGQHDRKLSSQIKRAGKLNNLPFELTLESISEIDKFTRAQDKEAMSQFNKDVEEWAEQSKQALRSSVKSMVRRDVSLSDSLKANIYYDTKYAKEVNRIGFSFVREGIYIHKGAGRGQGGLIGSRWITRHGQRKERADSSAGLQGQGNRKPIKWFDTVIDKHLPTLADRVAEYSATMQLDAANIFIDDRP